MLNEKKLMVFSSNDARNARTQPCFLFALHHSTNRLDRLVRVLERGMLSFDRTDTSHQDRRTVESLDN